MQSPQSASICLAVLDLNHLDAAEQSLLSELSQCALNDNDTLRLSGMRNSSRKSEFLAGRLLIRILSTSESSDLNRTHYDSYLACSKHPRFELFTVSTINALITTLSASPYAAAKISASEISDRMATLQSDTALVAANAVVLFDRINFTFRPVSITHSEGVVIVALLIPEQRQLPFSKFYPFGLGIDVQKYECKSTPMPEAIKGGEAIRWANSFLNQNELAYVSDCGSEQRNRLATLWTIKESIVKATAVAGLNRLSSVDTTTVLDELRRASQASEPIEVISTSCTSKMQNASFADDVDDFGPNNVHIIFPQFDLDKKSITMTTPQRFKGSTFKLNFDGENFFCTTLHFRGYDDCDYRFALARAELSDFRTI